jgi:hypothetical protein
MIQIIRACQLPSRGRGTSTRLRVLEGETIFFNDGICQNFARDSVHFGLRFILRDAAVESKFEILSLSYVVQTLVANLGECPMDGFTLRVEDTFF